MTTTTHDAVQAPPPGQAQGNVHPLTMFPLFRRWPCSWPRDIVYTLIWNTMIAGVFTLLSRIFSPTDPLAGIAWSTFVIANCIGFLIHGEMLLGERLFPGIQRRGIAARAAYYTALPLLGVFAGYWLATTLLHLGSFRAWVFSPQGFLAVGSISLLLSGILLAVFIPRERAARAEAALEREGARVASAERATALAQMKLLEAQIEPHFLYNTLAHVVSLVDDEPAQARRMLERLIELLRASAGNAGAAATLGAQAGLLRAYLELLELRMGARLAWSIDIPPDLATMPAPPMLLQPVVENAIRHGLEPKIEGGRIDVAARADDLAIVLTVADTGRGFAATRPAGAAGIGLANLRARLAALYGDAARLTIEDNVPAGARVTIRIPRAASAK